MNKILTISIAAYNVEKYIENTLNSILVKNIEDLEILVEDDGGTDNTANIIKKYEEKYPGIVKLVHKENGGYGSTVNKSIELAQGKYFKQLDGDDWYDSKNFERLLELLRTVEIDAVYSPYVRYNVRNGKQIIIDLFEKDIDGINKFDEIINKNNGHIPMYSILYKTELLRKYKLKLFENCFYTDTQYAMFPTINIDKILITHIPIYIYRIGIKGQSISIEGLRKHHTDYIKVSKSIIEFYNNQKEKITKEKRKYILKYAKDHISAAIGLYMILKPNRENLEKIKEFDRYVLMNNIELYDVMPIQNKIIKILRMTNYNYYIYIAMSILKMLKEKLK